MRRAVVDIGNTACRLVVAETAGGGWSPACDDREVQLGLGRAVRRDGRLGEGLIELTAETLRRLRDTARRVGADELGATLVDGIFGAVDGPELHRHAEDVLQVPVQVVDASDDVGATIHAARRRLGLAEVPGLVELTEERLRVAVPQLGGALCVVELPGGTSELVPQGRGDRLHPSTLGRIGGQIRELLVPLATQAPQPLLRGAGLRWPLLTGASGVALGQVTSGRHGADRGLIDGTRLSLARLTDLEHDLLAAYGARGRLGDVPPAVEALVVSASVLRPVLERLGARGVLISSASPVEGRVWSQFECRPEGADPAHRPVDRGPVGQQRDSVPVGHLGPGR